MSHYHLGINLGHDRSAAVVKDGEIVAAIHQERLDRCKHSIGFLSQAPSDTRNIQIPLESISYCLEVAGIEWGDLATITGNMPGIDYSAEILQRQLPKELRGKVRQIPSHHLAHAYTAYWPSGFDSALVLVADATGTTTPDGMTESYSIYAGKGTDIRTIHSEKVPAHLAGLSTLGFVYEYITRKAGFTTELGDAVSVPEAGKLMGLAPYGGPQKHWQKWLHTFDGSYSIGLSAYDIFLEIAALEKKYDTGEGKPYLRPYLVDLAYKVQEELEAALLHIADLGLKETGMKRLCLAGGVALNSVANYKMLTKLGLDDVFAFPAAGDAGIAAGCALWAYASQAKGVKRGKLRVATLGKTYPEERIKAALRKYENKLTVEPLDLPGAVERTAQALARGNIVARYEGGGEYGPRALGHRSILADPTFKQMRDIINARVKFREAFRPFAPVIPVEQVSAVFEQEVASPFMLLVSAIRPEYHEKIPSVTHHDGTGRIQTVTRGDNPFLHRLCNTLEEQRGGPPVVLNTSFNVAGQPIVETPEEAIETFLATDIDYLCIENFWVAKRNVPVLGYSDHLEKVGEVTLPHGLPPDQPAVLELMETLDAALFFGKQGSPWSEDELRRLSGEGGRFKETSQLFKKNPFGGVFRTSLNGHSFIVLNPLGQSLIADLFEKRRPIRCSLDEIKLVLALLGSNGDLERLRTEAALTTLEWKQRLSRLINELENAGLLIEPALAVIENIPDCLLGKAVGKTFEQFAVAEFSLRNTLAKFREALVKRDYTEGSICRLLGCESLQVLQPTHLHYYDRFRLPANEHGDLIRLFLLRGALPEARVEKLFGQECLNSLVHIGLLIPRGEALASAVDIYPVDGLLVCTDHRYMILDEDCIAEEPVMYIGLDSLGLVNSAPRYAVKDILDLCTGSGIQALVASRYAERVTAVDINPRAIRFARLNTQLNGVDNLNVLQGDLYSAVQGRCFDIILANPPFVPSPEQSLKFRDGGAKGEDILARIIAGSDGYLTPEGKLHIVTDLVDIDRYREKVKGWWTGSGADVLIMHTAKRDELLFSVPHVHQPFAQAYSDYVSELERWVGNYRAAGIQAVDFGYIFLHRNNRDHFGYHTRVVHSPQKPVHKMAKDFFDTLVILAEGKGNAFEIAVNPKAALRVESLLTGGEVRSEIVFGGEPFFTTYVVSNEIARLVTSIAAMPMSLEEAKARKDFDDIEQLVLKGILVFGPKGSGLRNADSVNIRPASGTTRKVRAIEELETKTTPTCLSSYLKR